MLVLYLLGLFARLLRKLQEYQQTEATLSQLVKETKQQDLINLEQRIQDFQIKAQEDIQQQRIALYTPVVDKFKKAIDDVAQENDYKFIIDNSNGVLLYYEDADNVAPLVRQKLGM